MGLLDSRVTKNVRVSNHVVVDRVDRLGYRMTNHGCEAMIQKFGKVSRHTPDGVHQGKTASSAWVSVDTGKSLLHFPLVTKTEHGVHIYLATTVIDRHSKLTGIRKVVRQLRIRRAIKSRD